MLLSDLKNFNFGGFDRTTLFDEVRDGAYDLIKKVKDGDIVVDIGASVGVISKLILAQGVEPKHIYMIEPLASHIKIIKENFKNINNYTLIEKAISNQDGTHQISWNSDYPIVQSMTFWSFLEDYNIEKIDFLKIDIESDEYYIFTEEYLDFLNNKTKTIVCEFHLGSPSDKEKFRNFRDNILPRMLPTKKHRVISLNGIDIAWDLPNEHFIQFYNCIVMEFYNL
jgi:FkbM family methyltransferase